MDATFDGSLPRSGAGGRLDQLDSEVESEVARAASAPAPPGERASAPHEDRLADYRRRTAEIDRLGDEIAVLSTQIQVATYELLLRIREFDRREGWGVHGAKSCAHWLSWRTSLDMGAARQKVRVARALEHLPLLAEAMRKGEISYSKARALTRIATPDNEAELVGLARIGTASHVERMVRACRCSTPKEEIDEVRRQHACRYLRVDHDEEGMVILRARLDAVAGAAVLRALDAASEALYRKGRAAEGSEIAEHPASGSGRAASRGQSAAWRGAAECASRDLASVSRPAPTGGAAAELAPGQRRADALVLLAESALAGGLDPGNGGDRYQVVLHVEAPAFADPSARGMALLTDTQHVSAETRVSAETCRRVACDAGIVVMTHAPDGSVLDVGRKTRSISPALRRALARRDRGCRFPGCGRALCDAHHVRHWAEGGETSLDNTLLLCRFHHRLVHDDGFLLKRLPDGEPEFRRPDGRLLPDAPMPPLDAGVDFSAEAIAARLRDGDVIVDPYTSTPTWDGASWELNLVVEWFLDETEKRRKRALADPSTPSAAVRGAAAGQGSGGWHPPRESEAVPERANGPAAERRAGAVPGEVCETDPAGEELSGTEGATPPPMEAVGSEGALPPPSAAFDADAFVQGMLAARGKGRTFLEAGAGRRRDAEWRSRRSDSPPSSRSRRGRDGDVETGGLVDGDGRRGAGRSRTASGGRRNADRSRRADASCDAAFPRRLADQHSGRHDGTCTFACRHARKGLASGSPAGGVSVLGYEIVDTSGRTVPFDVFHPQVHLDWNEDELEDAAPRSPWVMETSDN